MSAAPNVTARKWGGDDSHSWAVFIRGERQPFVSGLTKREVPYWKAEAERRIKAAQTRGPA